MGIVPYIVYCILVQNPKNSLDHYIVWRYTLENHSTADYATATNQTLVRECFPHHIHCSLLGFTL